LHQDLAPRNLLIDKRTDSLKLFDFGEAGNMGTRADNSGPAMAKGENAKRNDVKGVVILTVHEATTRDASYSPSWLHLLDEAPVLADPARWNTHPDVILDDGLTARDYYDELVRWVHTRRGNGEGGTAAVQIMHFAQAPRHIFRRKHGRWPCRWPEGLVVAGCCWGD